jgi:UV DNA damage endonuclease
MWSLIEARTALNRLGFAVKAFGWPGLKCNKSRRWKNDPHLKTGVEELHAIVDCLAEVGVRMYWISSMIATYVTHPDMPRFYEQIEESAAGLDGRIW